MELVPFSIINQYHKERLIHSTRYTGNEFSFLKVFQHGLSFSLTKQKQKLIKNYLGSPYTIQMFIYYLKSKRGSKMAFPMLRENVILDPGRVVKGNDGAWHSIYFDKISSVIGRENLTIISMKDKAGIPCDFEFSAYQGSLPVPDEQEKRMLHEVMAALKAARNSGQFTQDEMSQIRSALHIFFEDFRLYYNIFKNQSVKNLLFICHYHNEGLIAALKLLKIQCVEVQHGLIASNDLYYVYHEQFAPVISKAFFPDKILVYGPYWKRILEMGCEFRSHQINIAGDYLYRLSSEMKEKPPKENIVLVCAQKNLHEDYVSYGKQLAAHLKNHPDWRGIMKLHPLERNKQAYEELKSYGIEIVDIETPLDVVLSRSKIQISIYSTTFYDAFGFDVINFSLQDFGTMSDYASDMISEGVAAPINADEDPIAKFLHMKSAEYRQLPREDVYAPFNEAVLLEVLQG
ncbi:MAG: hypothetical protein IPP69_12920 [Flavobacteriales bacterium]|nr:hypothetical protein [Flavobacteriales bacterium]